MKISMWAGPAKNQIVDGFKSLKDVDLVICTGRDEFLTQIRDSHALLLSGGQYDGAVAKQVQQNAPHLRFIQVLTAGYDGLQINGVPKGIAVANAGDSWSPAVAEHSIALLLSLCKRLPDVFENQKKREWNRSFTSEMTGLDGKTITIVGYGSIAREIAKRLKPFGMNVLGVSRSGRPEPTADKIFRLTALNEAISLADVIVLCVPYSEDSNHLFGPKQFKACKSSAMLINIARGAIIDTDALVAALNEKTIAGAGLDVTDPEPLPPSHPLWLCPNLVISPHISGAAGERGWKRLAASIVTNVGRFVAGEPLQFLVDVPQL
jgi:phosphoglycerate dehydrogenase-like enzyme